jgi:hypothetical protein
MPTNILLQIALAALVGAMAQGLEHYFPWGMLFRKELPRLLAYILGTLGYVVPLTVLFVHWERTLWIPPHWSHLVALWACVAASGVTVLLVRGLDWLLDRLTRSYEHEERDAQRHE